MVGCLLDSPCIYIKYVFVITYYSHFIDKESEKVRVNNLLNSGVGDLKLDSQPSLICKAICS